MLNAPKSKKPSKMNLTVDGEFKARMEMLLAFQRKQGHPLTMDEAIQAMLAQMIDTLPELADFREYELAQDNV